MASNYRTAGSVPWVQVVSQTQVVPVQRVNIYTIPHASYIVVNVPANEWAAGRQDKYLHPVAAVVEQIWADGFISGTQFVQDTDPSTQLLADFLNFVVSYTPAGGLAIPYTTVVRVPVPALSSELAFTSSTSGMPYGEQIAHAYNQLVLTSTG